MSNQAFSVRKSIRFVCSIIIFLLGSTGMAVAQSTAFTYQGRLVDNGNLANTAYDMQFKLFDALTNGNQIGSTFTLDGVGGNPPAVSVTNGIFTVTLDFGTCSPSTPCFNGSARFLEIAVRVHGAGSYVTLTPRQPITAAPYALKTTNLAFNGALNNGIDIFFTASNTFAGESAGLNTTPDPNPTFATGKLNAFFGAGAGQANTTGSVNAFFGAQAGQLNTTGRANAFFGTFAGNANTTGFGNAFFGWSNGNNNTTGGNNAFFGWSTGFYNITGLNNTLIGAGANFSSANTTGNNNTALGYLSTVTHDLTNATAIGASASVTQSDSLVLGSNANVGIGTTAPTSRLHVVGDGLFTGNLTVTQYNIVSPAFGSSIRLLGISGTGDTNTFLGRNAAAANPTGSFNSFFGNVAGQSTLDGGNNSFFGSGSDNANVSGADNAFFGRNAGFANMASENAFFGSFAGAANTFGVQNSFFGKEAGCTNTTGSSNAFFGYQAGFFNTSGFGNAFFGYQAGQFNTTGDANAFFGAQAGLRNTTGFENASFGAEAGTNTSTGSNNAFFGREAAFNNTTGSFNAFFGNQAGRFNKTRSNNTFIGNNADFDVFDPTGDNNTLLGAFSKVTSGISNATAIGSNALVTASNSLVLGSINGINNATADTFVGIGTTAPEQSLHVVGNEILSTGSSAGFKFRDRGSASSNDDWVWYSSSNIARFFRAGVGDLLTVTTAGVVTLNGLGSAGSTSLCRNASNQLSTCSSSLRYKTNIATLHTGLSLINRLRPVTFDWKQNGEHDLGLVAEEVAKVEPLLVTHNDKGEIEGVKYDRVAVVLLNAVKEQQAQIVSQQAQLKQQAEQMQQQQREIEDLKRLICLQQPKAAMCKMMASPVSAKKLRFSQHKK